MLLLVLGQFSAYVFLTNFRGRCREQMPPNTYFHHHLAFCCSSWFLVFFGAERWGMLRQTFILTLVGLSVFLFAPYSVRRWKVVKRNAPYVHYLPSIGVYLTLYLSSAFRGVEECAKTSFSLFIFLLASALFSALKDGGMCNIFCFLPFRSPVSMLHDFGAKARFRETRRKGDEETMQLYTYLLITSSFHILFFLYFHF